MTNENLPPPFGELSREEKLALVVGYHCDGKAVEVWVLNRKEWGPINDPSWYREDRYRLAPEPEIPDSIDWDHVAEGFYIMTRQAGTDNAWLSIGNGEQSIRANNFASYKRGNMPSCTVRRPK